MTKLTINFFKNLPDYEKKITLSTKLTLLRIMLIPCIVSAMVMWYWSLVLILFILAVVTDILDGALARWRNEQTFLGACLDPIADKMLIVCCFFTLALVQVPFFTLPLWFVGVILIKELILIGGACMLYYRKGHIDIQPTMLGKITAAVQMGFVIWLCICYFLPWLSQKAYVNIIYIVILLVCASLVQYIGIGMGAMRR